MLSVTSTSFPSDPCILSCMASTLEWVFLFPSVGWEGVYPYFAYRQHECSIPRSLAPVCSWFSFHSVIAAQ